MPLGHIAALSGSDAMVGGVYTLGRLCRFVLRGCRMLEKSAMHDRKSPSLILLHDPSTWNRRLGQRSLAALLRSRLGPCEAPVADQHRRTPREPIPDFQQEVAGGRQLLAQVEKVFA